MWPQSLLLNECDKSLLKLSTALLHELDVLSSTLFPKLPEIGFDSNTDLIRYELSAKGSTLVFIPRPVLGFTLARFRPYWLSDVLFSDNILITLLDCSSAIEMPSIERCMALDAEIHRVLASRNN